MARKPIRKVLNVWTRKLHRWGAIGIAAPLIVIIVTGGLLQWKKDWAWVQPATQQGVAEHPSVGLDAILEAAIAVPEAGWSGWNDIDRLDVRPDRGVVKVRGKNRWEVQIDTNTGEVLQSTYRRSDLIEQIHDGSFFHDNVKLWIFFPAAVIFFCLWVTGLYLWILPISAKRNGRKRRESARAAG